MTQTTKIKIEYKMSDKHKLRDKYQIKKNSFSGKKFLQNFCFPFYFFVVYRLGEEKKITQAFAQHHHEKQNLTTNETEVKRGKKFVKTHISTVQDRRKTFFMSTSFEG